MRTLQIYGTASATANAVAQVTIPSSTRLKGISYWFTQDSITDNGVVRLELSKVPTSQIGTNGAQDPFFGLSSWANFVTSGLAISQNNGHQPLDVDCRQGEIIYLHCVVASSVWIFNGILWF